MPLFGPNVEKMEKKGDVKGLIKALNNENDPISLEARAQVAEGEGSLIHHT